MARIVKVNGLTNKGSYGLVEVVLDDGTEANVWVGGQVEVFYDREQIKAWVKRPTNNMLDIDVKQEDN
jgi:hypothetical protein